MKLAMPAFIASWTLIIVGIGYGIFVRGHDVLGVDFAGGDSSHAELRSGAQDRSGQVARRRG